MSSSKTEHYQLHKWGPLDSVLRAEFNQNFAALDAAARVVTGSYMGDGAEERIIDLGFTPRAVLLIYRGTKISVGNIYYGGLAVTGQPASDTAGVTLELVENGFKVFNHYGSHSVFTNDVAPFAYIAIR